ncbi:hypothetical protein [Paenibacillus sp. CMAA1364]
MKLKKIATIGLVTSSLILLSVTSAFAAPTTVIEFDKYRLEAINQELISSNLPTITDINSTSLSKGLTDEKTKGNIYKLKKAEIVIMTFNDDGELVAADSSSQGDALHRFGKSDKAITERSQYVTKSEGVVQPLSALPDSYPVPAGSTTGAFHRFTSPSSTTSLSYTGAVADDVTLPIYDTNRATTFGEAAYMYTGIDQNDVGIAEVGFGTYKGTQGNGWFALFHAKPTHDITTPSTGNDKDSYYYDFAHPYTGGQTIAGYKVYYHTTDSVLTLTYQIGYSNLYVVKFNGYNSLNKKVKRVTAIAMPIGSSGKFQVPYGSYGKWGNYRWLTNNGTGTVYPSAVSGMI